MDYEAEMTQILMKYKTRLDDGIISYNEVDTLISILMSEIIYKEKIRKMLDYSWDNNGEVLNIKQIEQ